MGFSFRIIILLFVLMHQYQCSMLIYHNGHHFSKDLKNNADKYFDCRVLVFGGPFAIQQKIDKDSELLIQVNSNTGFPLAVGIIIPIIPIFFLENNDKFSFSVYYMSKQARLEPDQIRKLIKIKQGTEIEFSVEISDSETGGESCDTKTLKGKRNAFFVALKLEQEIDTNKDIVLIVNSEEYILRKGVSFGYAPSVM